MNLSAAYNLLPDYSQSHTIASPRVHYPLSKTEPSARPSGDADAQRFQGQADIYKYYVLSDTREMVYTRRKNMEALFSSTKGSIVNLYA